MIVDNEELEKLKEKTIIEGNRYLVGFPGRKDKYDPVDILIEGEIPEFKSDADRFICAVEIGKFVRSNGFNGMEDNLLKLLETFSMSHRVLLVQQLCLNQMEMMAKDKRLANILRELMFVATT